MAPHLPEPPHRRTKPEGILRVAFEKLVQRRSDIVVLACHLIQGGSGSRPGEPWCLALREPEEVDGMSATDELSLASLIEPFGRELSQCLEHRESRVAVVGRVSNDEAGIRERCQPLEERLRFGEARSNDRGSTFDRPAAPEHRQSPEELLLRGLEQVVAPGDGRAETSAGEPEVSRPTREQREPMVEAGEHGRERQELHPRGRELEGKWQAVESTADLRDVQRVRIVTPGSGLRRRCPSAEEHDRIGPCHIDTTHLGLWKG